MRRQSTAIMWRSAVRDRKLWAVLGGSSAAGIEPAVTIAAVTRHGQDSEAFRDLAEGDEAGGIQALTSRHSNSFPTALSAFLLAMRLPGLLWGLAGEP